MIGLKWIILFIGFSANSQTTDIVSVNVPILVLKPGTEGTIRIIATVKKGFHIQSNQPIVDNLIPTTIRIDSTDQIIPGKFNFPSSKKFKLHGTNDFLEVYDGKFEITATLEIKRTAKRGLYQLKAVLRYQACDEKICFFPKSIAFTIPVEINE